jgi:hypothetical protein
MRLSLLTFGFKQILEGGEGGERAEGTHELAASRLKSRRRSDCEEFYNENGFKLKQSSALRIHIALTTFCWR